MQADRLDFPAQAFDGVAMDTREQMAFAPLLLVLAWAEMAAQDITFAFQVRQGLFDERGGLAERFGDLRLGQRAMAAQARTQ